MIDCRLMKDLCGKKRMLGNQVPRRRLLSSDSQQRINCALETGVCLTAPDSHVNDSCR